MRHDPPRGPRKPGGTGESPWRSAPRRDERRDDARPPRPAGEEPHSRDAVPHRGHAHPHSRSERREQRHRHGDGPYRDAGRDGERAPRPERAGHRARDEVRARFEDGDDEGYDAPSPQRARRDAEVRLYGLNAIRAVYARRPQAIRKLYLDAPRIPQLQPLLAWCVANRVGYRVVEQEDLDRLAASSHHEGVVADVLREEPVSLSEWLRDLPAGPQLALWLDGVGNPHNLGAILRSAAHFGVSAVLLPKEASLALSGAAARVAEGGAEAVPMVRMGRSDNALAQLRGAGFALAATVVKGGDDLFRAPLPERLVYVLGAEGEGMDRELAAACDQRLSIPGSGQVESLNVAAATAVLLAAWRARR
ncbi:RNA methyltransferase [Lysobacter sp. BMK333-48F3]|uniref:TrmH family RNA methyltransferase n=1 Tax=Lysobacter sp. BMK333-48F3 TaxID=2867962 RepID=UPI001C8C3B6A|nr:RNA methyltransferase [Lysobacter sp. BMK333-48F3]MBX9399949.1 RNA methyltransferase [Lysobacter sp. BMK333-48F3]